MLLGSTMLRRAVPFILICGVSLAQSGDKWTPAEQERFLLTARIQSLTAVGRGVNKSEKATLTDGRRTHEAQVQTIDVYTPQFKGEGGYEEREFKDSWKFNVAAWRLARMLGLEDMVPVAVMRQVNGKAASLVWWIDGVMMDEKERLGRSANPPDVPAWNAKMDSIRIFDQLIYNVDRSQENLLITQDWQVWMIDHTRSFRKWPKLRDPAAVVRCNPGLLGRLKALRRADLDRELGPLLTAEEIDGLMARRDLILAALRS